MAQLPLHRGGVVSIGNPSQSQPRRLPLSIRWFPQARFSTILFLTLLLSALSNSAMGALVNRTIDDTVGDPVTGFIPIYMPPTGAWADASCKGCAVQPDPTLAFDGTWTAATFRPEDFKSMSIELQFTGVAIYVFFILPNFSGNGTTTKTGCRFVLDGVPAGDFQDTPTSSTDMEYNALVFHSENLSNTTHDLAIVTDGFNEHIFVSFDYAIYTIEQDAESSAVPSSTSSTSSMASSTSSRTTLISVTSNKPTSASASSSSASASQSALADINPTGGAKHVPAAAIAGSVGAVLALLSGIVLFRFCFIRQQQQKRLTLSSKNDTLDQPPISPFQAATNFGYSQQFPGYGPGASTPGHPRGPRSPSGAYGALGGAVSSDRSMEQRGYAIQTRPMSVYELEANRSASDVQPDPHYTPASTTSFLTASPDRRQPSSGLAYLGSDVDAQSVYTNSQPHSPNVRQSVYSAYSGPSPGDVLGTTLRNLGFVASSVSGSSAPSQTARSAPGGRALAIANPTMEEIREDPTTEELRELRQQELQRQMEVIQNELNGMKELERGKSTVRDEREVSEMDELKRQIDFMRQQIGVLQGQRQSLWAQGLADEPPPGYTASHSPPQ
ncbi:hypothetical protein BDN72DRAFT_386309 [Pluteus cervinus]|uniref:Uncharacterized protein n=1 Tax=Pluteus cervinus TaxID=181527 RepID=A0ACD3A9U5_9AGAR|nr:hypothetical protein BDN72DRAFT_386309 [Pluteus cervinus]